MAGLVVAFAVLVVIFLPPVEHRVTLATGEIAIPARKDPTLWLVIVVCTIILLVITGQNTFSTYIAPGSSPSRGSTRPRSRASSCSGGSAAGSGSSSRASSATGIRTASSS